jgi:acetolactate synthase regulatory subunit
MIWRFDLVATQDRRLHSRILQAFENQMVDIRSLVSRPAGDAVQIICVVSSEQDKAYRLRALLYRLQNIRSVQVTEIEAAKKIPMRSLART